MPTPAETLLAKMRARREQWVQIDERRAIRVRRPTEAEMAAMLGGISHQQAVAACVDWRGWTDADLLGPELGSPDVQVPFSAEICRELLQDNVQWLTLVAQALADLIAAHVQARTAAAGN